MNNNPNFFTYLELKEQFPEIDINNLAVGSDGMHASEFNKHSSDIYNNNSESIINKTYIPVPYKERLILKGRNHLPRLISIPSIKDRYILSGLNNYIQNHILIEKQKMPQQLINELVKSINSYKYFVRIDLKSFYDNIDRKILINKLNKKTTKKYVDLIKPIIEQVTLPQKKINKIGIPQGLPVSNALAQLYLEDFSTQVNSEINSSCKVLRYVDDIIILHNRRDYKKVNDACINILEKIYKIKTNKDKSTYGKINLNTQINFLGYKFMFDNKGKALVTIRKETISKIVDKIIATIINLKKNNKQFNDYKEKLVFQLRIKISGIVINENNVKKKYGWIFFYSQINDYSVFFRLDKFINNILKKHFPPSEVSYINTNLKGFVRSYFEMIDKKSDSRFAVHPDEYTINEKKEHLELVEKIDISSLSDTEVHKKFNKKMYNSVVNLKEDMPEVSR